jgi:hypothetical protein
MIVFGIGGRVAVVPPAFVGFDTWPSNPPMSTPNLVLYEMGNEGFEHFREIWDCI